MTIGLRLRQRCAVSQSSVPTRWEGPCYWQLCSLRVVRTQP